jgi:hypothetical protein
MPLATNIVVASELHPAPGQGLDAGFLEPPSGQYYMGIY